MKSESDQTLSAPCPVAGYEHEMQLQGARESFKQTDEAIQAIKSKAETTLFLKFFPFLIVLLTALSSQDDVANELRIKYHAAWATVHEARAKCFEAEQDLDKSPTHNPRLAYDSPRKGVSGDQTGQGASTGKVLRVEETGSRYSWYRLEQNREMAPYKNEQIREGRSYSSDSNDVKILRASASYSELKSRKLELDRLEAAGIKQARDVEVPGAKLRLPGALILPLFQYGIFVLLLHFYTKRLEIWRLVTSTLPRFLEFERRAPLPSDRPHLHLPFWAAPVPSLSATSNHSSAPRYTSAQLVAASGWDSTKITKAIIAFVLAVGLIALQVYGAMLAPQVRWEDFLEDKELKKQLRPSSLLVLAITLWLVWRWFGRDLIPYSIRRQADPNRIQRWEVISLAGAAAACAILAFFPDALNPFYERLYFERWRIVAFAVGFIPAFIVLRKWLPTQTRWKWAQDKSRRRFVQVTGAFLCGLAARPAANHLWRLHPNPRFVRRKNRGKDREMQPVSLSEGFYVNVRFDKKKAKRMREAAPIGPLLGNVVYYVNANRQVVFPDWVASSNLKRIEPNAVAFEHSPSVNRSIALHVKLARSAAVFEAAALDQLRQGQPVPACELLFAGIRHDLHFKAMRDRNGMPSKGTPSIRLFDLLALIIHRFNLEQYKSGFAATVNEASALPIFTSVKSHRVRTHRYRHVRKKHPAKGAAGLTPSERKKERDSLVKKGRRVQKHDRNARHAQRLKMWEKRKINWQSETWQNKILKQNSSKTIKWVGLPM